MARSRLAPPQASIDCDSDEYLHIRAIAWLAIGVYAFGLLAFNAILLFCARKAILSGKPTTLSTALKFLYKECALSCRALHQERSHSIGILACAS